MGKRGPRPTPTAILRMRGSWLAKTRGEEPMPDIVDPDCAPDWLNDDAAAEWDNVIPLIRAMRIFSAVDTGALARYCDVLARWKKASAFIAKNGESFPIKSETGVVRGFAVFPQATQYIKLGQMLGRLEAEFGMTPSSRSSVKVVDKPKLGADRFFGSGNVIGKVGA